MTPTYKAVAASPGFTLIETLAAFAIFGLIIVSTGLLLHDGIFFFDRGTRAVDQQEQLSLAMDCLRRDFGAARFVVQKTDKGIAAAFVASPVAVGGPMAIHFVTHGRTSGSSGLEMVGLSVETQEGVTELVRRRAAWADPRIHLADAALGDAVVLVKGKFDITFAFSDLAPDGKLTWHDSWTGENGLPHSVRMMLQDASSGPEPRIEAEFPIYADAQASCATGKRDCLSLVAIQGLPAPRPSAAGQGHP
jgi:type II secretory pathway component PulJ